MTAEFFRSPRFEQFRDTRQAAGDVTGLGAFGRDTGDNVARTDFAVGIDRDDGVDRQHVTGITAARKLQDFAVLALDNERRTQILLAAGRPRTPVDHHAFGDTGRFVERLGQ